MCPDEIIENGVKKLAHHLDDKKNYVVHHKVFKEYLKQGMILKKINRIVFYCERAWIKEYIEFCLEQRKIAELSGNEFLVVFFQLMCNANFGKSMENIRNRVNFKLVNDEIQLQKELNKEDLEGSH